VDLVGEATKHGGRARTKESLGAAHDRVEDGLQVSGRTGDHPQNLTGRRLLIEGRGEILILNLQLLEQPNILDGR